MSLVNDSFDESDFKKYIDKVSEVLRGAGVKPCLAEVCYHMSESAIRVAILINGFLKGWDIDINTPELSLSDRVPPEGLKPLCDLLELCLGLSRTADTIYRSCITPLARCKHTEVRYLCVDCCLCMDIADCERDANDLRNKAAELGTVLQTTIKPICIGLGMKLENRASQMPFADMATKEEN